MSSVLYSGSMLVGETPPARSLGVTFAVRIFGLLRSKEDTNGIVSQPVV